MGKLEKQSRERARKVQLKKYILQAVQVAGLLGVALVAPNVIEAMGKLGIIPSRRHPATIAATRKRLVAQGFLEYHGNLLRLTPKGVRALRAMELQDFSLHRPKRWDQKWRALIFDIPERRRGLREKVRQMLITIGFEKLQDSVWVYPYDCEDVVILLKADLHIGSDVRYLIVDSIEDDRALRKHFKL